VIVRLLSQFDLVLDGVEDLCIHTAPPTASSNHPPPTPHPGTVLLWFGWYGFNPGSTLNIIAKTQADSAALYLTSGRAAVTTTLSGAAAVVVALVSSLLRTGAWDLLDVCNGALVGFVSITAGAAVVEPWAAIVVGAVGVAIFDVTCWLWLRLRIDDPLSASPMHGVCGAWGVVATGLLAAPHYMKETYPNAHFGALYKGSSGRLLAAQVVGVAVIAAWTCFWSGEDRRVFLEAESGVFGEGRVFLGGGRQGGGRRSVMGLGLVGCCGFFAPGICPREEQLQGIRPSTGAS